MNNEFLDVGGRGAADTFFSIGRTAGLLSTPANFAAVVALLNTEDRGYIKALRDKLNEALEAAGKEADRLTDEKVADHGRIKALWLYGLAVLPPHREPMADWIAEMDSAIALRQQMLNPRRGVS